MKGISYSKYEIVWITNSNEIEKNKDLVDAFFELYEDESNFPDPDEREEPEFIKERIIEGSNDPHTHLMAFNLIEEGISKFVAGCIVEFYPDCSCVLITYVFVNKDYRGLKVGEEQKKIGEILLKSEHGLKGLINYFENSYNREVKAVLFESNNPFETPEENDSMPPAKRLKFFKNIGAKRVNFSYIQPPLGDDKAIVTNLYLLTFPDLVGLNESIEIETVMNFVMELAKSLDRNKEPNSTSKYGLHNYIIDLKLLHSQLKGINKIENSGFIGLNSENRNILIETYNNLLLNSDKNGNLALTDIPIPA
jgi:hypothetical protein